MRRVLFCLMLISVAHSQEQRRWLQSLTKNVINMGSSAVSKGMNLGNKVVQTGTALVSSGIEKGTLAGKLVVGSGLAVAGHALAVGSLTAVNGTGKVNSFVKDIPIVSNVVKATTDKVLVVIGSTNKVGQAVINGVDSVANASHAMVNKATSIGAGAVSNVAKAGTAAGHMALAVGSTVVQTGVDNAFALGRNVFDQVTTGNFNMSALGTNVNYGAKWLINDNAQHALDQLISSLNTTLT